MWGWWHQTLVTGPRVCSHPRYPSQLVSLSSCPRHLRSLSPRRRSKLAQFVVTLQFILYSRYPFGFWYDGEMAEQLRSGRIPRTTRNLSNNDRSVVLRAISVNFLIYTYIALSYHCFKNFRKERKRQMKEPHDIHHEVFTELLTRWRNLHPEHWSHLQIPISKRSQDIYGFIKKTVVPFPRLGWLMI